MTVTTPAGRRARLAEEVAWSLKDAQAEIDALAGLLETVTAERDAARADAEQNADVMNWLNPDGTCRICGSSCKVTR